MKPAFALIGTAGVLAVLGIMLLLTYSAPAEALAPTPLQWNAGKSSTALTAVAQPGTTQTFTVWLTASTTLSHITLSVVPALASFVRVNPTSLPVIQKGQTATVNITVSPGASAPLTVTEGTIQGHVGASVIATPLPVQIIVTTGGNGLLPPDPGDTGKATLAGIDSDNDGVRDDIERYIWLTYPASAKTRRSAEGFLCFDTGVPPFWRSQGQRSRCSRAKSPSN